MLSREGYVDLLLELKEEFPEFKITKRTHSKLLKFFDVILKVISLGKLSNFMNGFVTTVGNVIYVPDAWETWSSSRKAIVLRHERIHMRQVREMGKFKFFFLYLLFPFPTIFAFYRAKFEKEAYEESLKAYYEYYGSKFFTNALREEIIKNFTTANYFWMWPWRSKVERWYDHAVADIKSFK